ncbi:hypothetical protein BC831DRAFT_467462 [Entophlyctis helioformis]|nr:hypothetical protein BC831DRAFT_467462 [Entophlyctis helioformis]
MLMVLLLLLLVDVSLGLLREQWRVRLRIGRFVQIAASLRRPSGEDGCGCIAGCCRGHGGGGAHELLRRDLGKERLVEASRLMQL